MHSQSTSGHNDSATDDRKEEEAEDAGSDIAASVQAVIMTMLPTIVTVVQEALAETLLEDSKQIEEQIKQVKEQSRQMTVMAAIERDRLKQYSRRETGMHKGDQWTRGELAASCGQGGRCCWDATWHQNRHLCQTPSWKTTGPTKRWRETTPTDNLLNCKDDEDSTIMKGKKYLKNSDTARNDDPFTDKESVVDDLTNWRARLPKFAEDLPRADFAYCARDAAVVYTIPSWRLVKMETPGDLFSLEVEAVNYEDFYQCLTYHSPGVQIGSGRQIKDNIGEPGLCMGTKWLAGQYRLKHFSQHVKLQNSTFNSRIPSKFKDWKISAMCIGWFKLDASHEYPMTRATSEQHRVVDTFLRGFWETVSRT